MSSFATQPTGLQFATCARSQATPSANAIALGAHCLAVIDGADDLAGEPWAGLTPGRLAAITVQDSIEALPAEPDPHELVRTLSEAVLAVRDEVRDVLGPSASLVAYLPRQRVIVRVGAGGYRIDSGPGDLAQIPLEVEAAHRRAEVSRELLSAGLSEAEIVLADPGRQLVMPILRSSRHWANAGVSGLGYGAITGDPIPPRFIEIIPVPTGSRVVLTTGYPEVSESFDQAEIEIARQITEDPLRIGPGQEGVRGLLDGESWVSDRSYLSFDT